MSEQESNAVSLSMVVKPSKTRTVAYLVENQVHARFWLNGAFTATTLGLASYPLMSDMLRAGGNATELSGYAASDVFMGLDDGPRREPSATYL